MQNKTEKFGDLMEKAKEGFLRSWKNRFLWFWGFFIMTGTGLGLNFSEKEQKDLVDFYYRIEDYWQIVLVSLIVLVILYFLFKLIAVSGVIQAIDRLQNKDKEITGQIEKRSDQLNFSFVWQQGKLRMWRAFWVELAFLGVWLLFILVAILITFLILVSLEEKIAIFVFLGMLVFFSPILIVSVFLVNFLYRGALIVAVLSRQGLVFSVKKIWSLLLCNIATVLKLSLVAVIIGFAKNALFVSAIILMIIPVFLIALVLGFSKLLVLNILLTFILGAIALAGLVAGFIVISLGSLTEFDLWIWWIKSKEGVTRGKLVKEEEVLEKEFSGLGEGVVVTLSR